MSYLSFTVMDMDDIILLLAFEVIDDLEAVCLISLLDEERKIPDHLKYTRFHLQAFSDAEFVENFRFEKADIMHLIKAMNLNKEYVVE